MTDNHERPLKGRKLPLELSNSFRIQIRSRFVEKKQLRPRIQRLCDSAPGSFAAGESVPQFLHVEPPTGLAPFIVSVARAELRCQPQTAPPLHSAAIHLRLAGQNAQQRTLARAVFTHQSQPII